MNQEDDAAQFAQRDAWVLGLLGIFFVIFGVLVLAGLFWPQTGVEKLVTLASGLILLVVGTAGILIARHLKGGRSPAEKE